MPRYILPRSFVRSTVLDHFLATVLNRRKHFVKGGQSELDEIVGK
jgi:hypothetical protein